LKNPALRYAVVPKLTVLTITSMSRYFWDLGGLQIRRLPDQQVNIVRRVQPLLQLSSCIY
jgi:hypothetical protein